jgi:S1-C subfamily serine protease
LLPKARRLIEAAVVDTEEVNRQLEIKPTDSWFEVVGKAKTLRDFGRITEAVGAFSRYTDMFSATDPTAKRYSKVAVQFTLQLDALGVKGGMYLYELKKGGAAERAGLQVSDILTSYDGKLTPGNPEFIPALKDAHSDEPVKVEYLRMDEKGKFHRRTAALPGGSLGAGAMPI